LQKNLETLGPIAYTPEEQVFRQRRNSQESVNSFKIGVEFSEIKPLEGRLEHSMGGSTDVGDVSWNVPVIRSECLPLHQTETPLDSWAVVACGGIVYWGHKGMGYALAKAIA